MQNMHNTEVMHIHETNVKIEIVDMNIYKAPHKISFLGYKHLRRKDIDEKNQKF